MSTVTQLPRQGIPLRPDRDAVERDWHRSFVRASTAKVLAGIQKTNAGEILSTSWPDDARAALILRGAVSPTKAADLPGGSVVRLMLLAPSAAYAKLFRRAAIRVDLAGISQFLSPLPTSFTPAKFVAEMAPISEGQGTFAGMPLGPVKKIALIAALSNELESASGDIAATIIEHVLKVVVGNGIDKVLFDNVAGDEIRPPGLLYGVTPIAGSADMSKDLSALVASISAAGIDTESVVFIAAAGQAMAMKLLAGPHFNHPVTSANITAGTVIAVATAGLAVAGDGVPQIDTSKHPTIHMADPASHIAVPGTPSTIAVPTYSLFQTDMLALRCIARICWSVAPGSVAVCTGASW